LKFLSTLDKGLLPILLTVLLLAFGMSFVAPLIPLVIRDTGASPATIGQIASIYFLTFTLFTPFLGRLVDRVGSKKIISTGLFVYALAILLMAFSPSPFYFYLIRIFQGIGTACLFAPTESAINVLSSPEKRASNMGLYGLIFAAGFALGPGLGTYLFSIHRVIPFIFGTVSSLVGLLVMVMFYEDVPIPIQSTRVRLHEFLRVIKIPLIGGLCYAVVEVSIGSFLSLYLDYLGFRGAALGLVFTSFAIGGIISPYPAGKMADRIGKKPSLYLLGILLSVITFCFNLTPNYVAIVGLTFGIGIISGGLYPIALSLIGDLIPPDQMGTANSTFSFLYGVGSILGPVITGWVMRIMGMQYLFYPMTIAAVIFVIITLMDRKREKALLRG
jgi:MFS family permease